MPNCPPPCCSRPAHGRPAYPEIHLDLPGSFQASCDEAVLTHGIIPCLVHPRCASKDYASMPRQVEPWCKPICCRPLCQRPECCTPIDCGIDTKGSAMLCGGRCVTRNMIPYMMKKAKKNAKKTKSIKGEEDDEEDENFGVKFSLQPQEPQQKQVNKKKVSTFAPESTKGQSPAANNNDEGN